MISVEAIDVELRVRETGTLVPASARGVPRLLSRQLGMLLDALLYFSPAPWGCVLPVVPNKRGDVRHIIVSTKRWLLRWGVRGENALVI